MFHRFSRSGVAMAAVCFASLLQLPCLADSEAASEGWTSAGLSATNQSGGFTPLYNGPPQGYIDLTPNAQAGHLWNGDNQYSADAQHGNAYGDNGNRTRGNTQLWRGHPMNLDPRQGFRRNAAAAAQANATRPAVSGSAKPFTVDANGIVHTADERGAKAGPATAPKGN